MSVVDSPKPDKFVPSGQALGTSCEALTREQSLPAARKPLGMMDSFFHPFSIVVLGSCDPYESKN